MHLDSKANLGKFGEDLVCQWLKNNSFQLLEKNYSKRFGEIDLIATKGDVVAFIEVKTRKTNYFDLSEVITPLKQKKIILTAKHYVSTNHLQDKIIRFDVALVVKAGNSFEIKYIQNAFTESF